MVSHDASLSGAPSVGGASWGEGPHAHTSPGVKVDMSKNEHIYLLAKFPDLVKSITGISAK